MVVIIAIALHFKNASFAYLFSERFPARPVIYLLSGLFAFCFAVILDPISSAIPLSKSMEEAFGKGLEKDIFSFVAVAISAPVLEELLFRKIIIEGLEHNYGARKAIFWSAILFAVFHMNVWQGVSAFGMGLILGWLYLKSRDIWLCIFVHSFINSIFFFVFLASDDPFFSVLDLTGSDYYTLSALLGISLLTMYFCYRSLNAHFQLQADERIQKTQTKPIHPDHS